MTTTPPEMQTVDLLPCPFCGSSPSYTATTIKGVLYERIACNNDDECGMFVDCGLDDGHIIKQWNTRCLSPFPVEACIAEMEAELERTTLPDKRLGWLHALDILRRHAEQAVQPESVNAELLRAAKEAHSYLGSGIPASDVDETVYLGLKKAITRAEQAQGTTGAAVCGKPTFDKTDSVKQEADDFMQVAPTSPASDAPVIHAFKINPVGGENVVAEGNDLFCHAHAVKAYIAWAKKRIKQLENAPTPQPSAPEPVAGDVEHFERWYCDRYGEMYPLARYSDGGDYYTVGARRAWCTWQAALAAMPQAGGEVDIEAGAKAIYAFTRTYGNYGVPPAVVPWDKLLPSERYVWNSMVFKCAKAWGLTAKPPASAGSEGEENA